MTRINDPMDMRSNAASFKTGFGIHRMTKGQRGSRPGDMVDVDQIKKTNDLLINGIRSLPDPSPYNED